MPGSKPRLNLTRGTEVLGARQHFAFAMDRSGHQELNPAHFECIAFYHRASFSVQLLTIWKITKCRGPSNTRP